MDLWMIALRLIHIFAGIAWVGFGLFTVFLLTPAVRQLGPDGQKFMRGFLKQSHFNLIMPVMSLLTTVAGLLLFYEVSDGFNSDWMGSDGGIVLSIGVTAGLLAFGHGGATTSPITARLVKLGDEIDVLDGPPSDEQRAQLGDLQRKMGLHGRISVGLMIISVIGMASARYM